MKEYSVLQKTWRAAYPPVLYLVIQVLMQIVFTIATTAVFSSTHRLAEFSSVEEYNAAATAYSLQFSVLIVFASAVVSIPIFLMIYRSDSRRLQEEKGVRCGKMKAIWYLAVIVLAIEASSGFNILISLIASLLPKSFTESFSEVSSALSTGGPVLQVLALVIAGPIVEELVFRGLVYRRLKFLFNVKVAMFFSALAFGVFHGNLVQGLYAAIIGFIMAWIYEKCKSLWASMVFHMTANGFSLLTDAIGLYQGLNNLEILVIMFVELGITLLVLSLMEKKVHVEETYLRKESDEYVW